MAAAGSPRSTTGDDGHTGSGGTGPSIAVGVDLQAHFAGCNRTPGSADWASRLAYAAGNTVVVCDPKGTPGSAGLCPVEHLLVGHTDRVNCVKWAARRGGGGLVDTTLVSGATDASVIVWRNQADGGPDGATSAVQQGVASQWVVDTVLKGHTGAVTCIDALESGGGGGAHSPSLVCSGSADGTLRVWASGCAPAVATGEEPGTAPDAAAAVGGYSAVQTVSFGSGFALAVALATLPNDPSIPVLAVGGDDFFVRLYVFQSTAAESAAGGCGDPPPSSARFGGEFALVAQLPGHQDWIRSLAFATFDSGVLMLASGAQDMFIRLWQIEPRLHQGTATKGDGESEGSRVSDGDGGAAAATPLSTFRRKALEGFDSGFAVSSAKDAARYSVRLDSLLMGHDNWVYSVRWHPRLGDTQPAVLLSASMDRTLMLWTPDPSSGVWIDAARMGETGGTYTNGLFGGLLSPSGTVALAHGFHGAFYLWECVPADGAADSGAVTTSATAAAAAIEIGRRWTPQVAITGHFLGVRDLGWDPTGSTFCTASDDQTVRIYAQCNAPASRDGPSTAVGWHEIARPQIHGYDLRCLAIVDTFTFATGADEKIIRVFEAPTAYVHTLRSLTDFPLGDVTVPSGPERPIGASIPALGLSNKAVLSEDLTSQLVSGPNDSNTFNDGVVLPFENVTLRSPPLETHLVQNSLWPEARKLYGHGFELVSLSVSSHGDFVLSSCKATTKEHAVIRVWNTKTWDQVGELEGHKLTVTRTAFSPSDEWVVSGSRDRQVCIYRRQTEPGQYALHQTIAKAHDRIIWDVVWTPSGDDAFATGARDKMVKFWKIQPSGKWELASKLGKLAESVTALDWVHSKRSGLHLLAVGFDDGRLEVFSTDLAGTMDWVPFHTFPKHLCHTSTVRRIRWRPPCEDAARGGGDDLATCSIDGSVRLFRVNYT